MLSKFVGGDMSTADEGMRTSLDCPPALQKVYRVNSPTAGGGAAEAA